MNFNHFQELVECLSASIVFALATLTGSPHTGKTRLAKYYIPLEDSGKRQMEYDVHRAIASRDPKHTNFVEVQLFFSVLLMLLTKAKSTWRTSSLTG